MISSLILWRLVGRVQSRKLTYLEVTVRDSGLDMRDLSVMMVNHGVWKGISMNVPFAPVVKGSGG